VSSPLAADPFAGDAAQHVASQRLDRPIRRCFLRAMPAFWGVARTLPQRETFAVERLAASGFETFAPQVKTKRAPAPLFRGYVFVRILEQWQAINTTIGVLCLVKFGDCPARCPDNEVDRLKAMIDRHGFVSLPDGWGAPIKRQIAIGAKVKVTAGPFGGMAGLDAGMSTKDRERVLLHVLGGQGEIRIASNLVVPAQ
jgi:transcription antitermination factor NusG